MNACTTNPPVNESTANSPDRPQTARRDLRSDSRALVRVWLGASTPAESDAATAAPARETGTNTRNHVGLEGAPAHAERARSGRPAARAPNAPVRVATAL